MKGDFTRNTFAPEKHFLRVFMQQGRVQLDADWNEQAAILLHYLQTLAADIIGPYAGPAADWGFGIGASSNGDFSIGKGRYYVNGILCENGQDCSYLSQLDFPLSKETDALQNGIYIAYLDVWERHISFVEDDDIREKALNGADTATRSKVIWQVKTHALNNQEADCQYASGLLSENLLALSQVCMAARAKQGQAPTQPCLIEPEAQYRGAENQLYRVEIHDGNLDENGQVDQTLVPTFKFSSENGSVIFPIKSLWFDAGTVVAGLGHLGCDHKLGLAVDDWLEFIDDKIELHNQVKPLAQVTAIDAVARTVTLNWPTTVALNEKQHAYFRRWDQSKANKLNADGVVKLTADVWLSLEDGVEVKFSIHETGRVRHGDYWLIPARHGIGDVEWPILMDELGNVKKDAANNPIPELLPPMGTLHYYAPLAILNVNVDNGVVVRSDCRCSFNTLSAACKTNKTGRIGIGIDGTCQQEDVQQ